MRALLKRSGLVAGLLLTASGVTAQEGSGGSSVPCAVPLGWRIAEMDARFELTPAEARAAMADAARLWETALGRPLFPEDPGQGMPVAFVYDDRQATQQMRTQLEEELSALGSGLEERRGQIDEQVRALRSLQAEHEARAAALGRSMDGHNAEILRWNREGGAPDSVRIRLGARGEALDGVRHGVTAYAGARSLTATASTPMASTR